MFEQFNVTKNVVQMNEWGCKLYGGVGNLLTFVSSCDKNMGVCCAGYSPENTVIQMSHNPPIFQWLSTLDTQ